MMMTSPVRKMAGWKSKINKQLFYSGIRLLEKRGIKCIADAGDYVEKWKYDIPILWLSVSLYKLFEWPS